MSHETRAAGLLRHRFEEIAEIERPYQAKLLRDLIACRTVSTSTPPGAFTSEAMRVMGSSHARTLWRAILPSCLPALIVLLSFSVANAILYESGLSFLGLGAQPPQPSWGTMLSSAKSYMFDDPWYTAIVGVSLSATIIALSPVGDAIRETIDPLLSGLR
jgi:hypothetical protein